MTQPEPLVWIKIVNPDAADIDRIGWLVTELDEIDGREPIYAVAFCEGDTGAFFKSEFVRIYAS